MNEVTQQAHRYATILMNNLGGHNMKTPEAIADFSLRLAKGIDRGLTEMESVKAATGESPAIEEPVDGTTDPYTEIDKAIERYMPDWTKAPEWANWFSVTEKGIGSWRSCKPVALSNYGCWSHQHDGQNRVTSFPAGPSTRLWENLIYERPKVQERPITGRHGPECTCTEEDEKAFIELLQQTPLLPIILALGLSNK